MSQQSTPQKSSSFRSNTDFYQNAREESPSFFTTTDFKVSSSTQASSPIYKASSQRSSVAAQKDDFTKSMKLGYIY